jgi:hypothetical protein
MRKAYFLIGTICLACVTAFISARYVGLAPAEDKIQNSATARAHTQLTAAQPPEKYPKAQTTPSQTHSPIAPLPHHIDQSIDTPPMAITSSLISDNSRPIDEQELAETAQKLITSADRLFAVDIDAAQLSGLKPNTVINLDLPQIGLVDYIIQDISSQNGITSLSGHINGDSNSIRGIHISWKDNAMFGSISTPHNVLHLATINNKHFLFIANPELTD